VRGSFQSVQRRVPSRTERGAACLTTERLDPLSMPMPAIADQRMEESVSVAKVLALRVRTSEPFGRYASGALPGGFLSRAMVAPAEAPALHPTRVWRRDDRQDSRLGSAAMPLTGGLLRILAAAFDGTGTG